MTRPFYVPVPPGFRSDATSASYTFCDAVTVAVSRTERTTRDGKPYWRWVVSDPESFSDGNDLASWGDAAEALGAMITFLLHSAERYRSTMGGAHPDGEGELFPDWVCEWAFGAETELSLAALEPEGGA